MNNQNHLLPCVDPRSERPRCGGRQGKFLAADLLWPIAVAVAFFLGQPAKGALVTVTAEGTVFSATVFNGTLPMGVMNGSPVFATWSYDSNASFTPLVNGRRYASGLNLEFSITIAGNIWSGTGNAIDIFDNNPWDVYTVRAFEDSGAIYTSFPLAGAGAFDRVLLTISDNINPYEALSSLALPASDGDINTMAIETNTSVTFGEIQGENINGEGYRVKFNIDPNTVAIPEPSSVLLFLAGCCPAILRRRRQVR